MNKYEREALDGILLLDKPCGISSNLALQKAKHYLQAQKGGHTGSLDPLATGMLPICFGQARKISRFLLEERKCYQTTLQLGVTTTTGDAEGEIISVRTVPQMIPDLIVQIISRFQGHQQQIPPMYSAIKHQGQPLYKLARQGKEIYRAPRAIVIHHLSLENIDEKTGFITLKIVCSKGTYIRTLVEDIGNALGCGAHIRQLRRLWVWPFEHDEMMTMLALKEKSLAARGHLLTMQSIVPRLLPILTICQESALRLTQGQQVQVDSTKQGWVALMTNHGNFLGIGELSDGRLVPKRLLAQNEPHLISQ